MQLFECQHVIGVLPGKTPVNSKIFRQCYVKNALMFEKYSGAF